MNDNYEFNKLIWPAMRSVLLAVLLFLFGRNVFAANVVYIDDLSKQSLTHKQVEAVAAFYGLDLVTITAKDNKVPLPAVSNMLRDPNTAALVINANALFMLDRMQVMTLLHTRKQRIPLFIAGINKLTDPVMLSRWSLGAIVGYDQSDVINTKSWYVIDDVHNVTCQLTGTTLPLNQKSILYLKFGLVSVAQPVMDAKIGSAVLPVFVQTVLEGQEIFFATEEDPNDIPVTPDPYRQEGLFAALAPQMMFMRYAGGDSAWHTPGDYANFTIDDLWLKEPYGHVNYEKLLRESEHHNFHTTIAFIPWNFDRSQSKVVSLFQAHPDRFSITIHGDNHIHQEFGPLADHPLRSQVKDMMQGLARMKKFEQLTKLPYDAVMVFPHSISPMATFSALKGANYMATANSLNVPSDAQTPSGIEFALRTSSLRFANFPSLRRYSAENDIPTPQLAIDAFLGNPMLFYAHESFFAKGIDAFNKTADVVNRIQPDVKWEDLGEIVRHLYLEKQDKNGDFDIRALSGTIQITNTHKRDTIFLIEKDEDFSFPLTVLVDGQPYPFQSTKTQIRLRLPIANGASRLVEIKYDNGMRLAEVNIAKTSTKVTIIRLLSDFRDNVVSDTRLGRWFIRSYVDYGRNWNRAAIIVIFAILILFSWSIRHKRKEIALGTDTRGAGQSNQR